MPRNCHGAVTGCAPGRFRMPHSLEPPVLEGGLTVTVIWVSVWDGTSAAVVGGVGGTAHTVAVLAPVAATHRGWGPEVVRQQAGPLGVQGLVSSTHGAGRQDHAPHQRGGWQVMPGRQALLQRPQSALEVK